MILDWIEAQLDELLPIAVGFALGLLGASFGEYRRRKRASEDVAVSLYHEVADRSARCLNDYVEPWEELIERGLDLSKTADWVGKFRPTDPIVYPSVAGKLGLLRREAIGPTLQFYFALDALRREIDGVVADFSGSGVYTKAVPPDRLRLVRRRLKNTLAPALRTLEALNVNGWQEIDVKAMGDGDYPHVTDSYSALRDGLRAKCRLR